MHDIHCHILPGVDDGSRDKEESLAMLEAARAAGIDAIVCTPHYKSHNFHQSKVDAAFEWFVAEAEQMGITAYLGYEIHWKKVMECGIEAAAEHAIEDTGYALIEFSVNSDIGQYEQRGLWKLKGLGITPIIAHPERYARIQKDPDLAAELKDMGCLLQLSADAVCDSFFSPRRKLMKKLLKAGLYDCVASDAHCVADYEDFLKAKDLVEQSFDL